MGRWVAARHAKPPHATPASQPLLVLSGNHNALLGLSTTSLVSHIP